MKILAKNRDGYLIQVSEYEAKKMTGKWPDHGPSDGQELPMAEAFNELRAAFAYNSDGIQSSIAKLEQITKALKRLEPIVNPIFKKGSEV